MKLSITRILAFGAFMLLATLGAAQPASRARVVNSYPHDPGAFTQGLLIVDGVLFESTGRYSSSTLRRVALESGRVRAMHKLAANRFGEGLTLVGDRLYQLTWKAGVAYVYDYDTLAPVDRRYYSGQGWGLARLGRHLIMSDGSATLRFLNPVDFSIIRCVTVRRNDHPVRHLNELEVVDGDILANVWRSDEILRIDADTGTVIGVIHAGNLRELLPNGRHAGALNGIAWDAEQRRLFVTGKNWPRLFHIRLPKLDGS